MAMTVYLSQLVSPYFKTRSEQVNEITETVAHLMELPLPFALKDLLSDALNEADNRTVKGSNTSTEPSLIRIWLPNFIREQASS